ncbi:hypothetical protein QC764_208322 [Podospora pseudoanserina]|uniref:Uncharacterized protein n=1 Tax=Podospora pseudoanserina TaxID=2609844 RepID=A0ABR0IHN3_9PEZI|nr:hypothetical protein QC764_208322 [Podospora pseudoanserina]
MSRYDDDGGYGVTRAEDPYDECSPYRSLYEDGNCHRTVPSQPEWCYSEDLSSDKGKGKARVDTQPRGGSSSGSRSYGKKTADSKYGTTPVSTDVRDHSQGWRWSVPPSHRPLQYRHKGHAQPASTEKQTKLNPYTDANGTTWYPAPDGTVYDSCGNRYYIAHGNFYPCNLSQPAGGNNFDLQQAPNYGPVDYDQSVAGSQQYQYWTRGYAQ